MCKNIYCLFSVFLFLVSPISCGSKQKNHDFIISVHDGDTFRSNNQRYRLFGVDTPELSSPNTLNNQWNATESIENLYANEAMIFARDRILHKNVHIEFITTDHYNRTVAKINFNNEDLGLSLVRNGLARVAYISLNKSDLYYTDDVKYYKLLCDAQFLAYNNNIGVWFNHENFSLIFPKA